MIISDTFRFRFLDKEKEKLKRKIKKKKKGKKEIIAPVHNNSRFAQVISLRSSYYGYLIIREVRESDITYIGKSIFVDKLVPESSIFHKLHILFTSSGTYNINRWKLKVDFGQSLETRSFVQVPSIRRFIEIVNL